MTINSSEGRWSISLCTCSQDTVHFYYGNAILHISVQDVKELGMAMQRLADSLKCQSSEHSGQGEKKRLIH